MLFVFLFVSRSLYMFLCPSPCLVWRSLFGNRKVKGWKSSRWDILFRAVPEINWKSQYASDESSNFFPRTLCLLCVFVVSTQWSFYFHSSTHLASHCAQWAWKGVLDTVRQSDKHLIWSILRPWVVLLLTFSVVNLTSEPCYDSCGDWVLCYAHIKHPAETSSLQKITCQTFDSLEH